METEARLRVTDKRPHSQINHPHALVGGHNGPHVICLSKTLSFYRPRARPLLGEIIVQSLRKDKADHRKICLNPGPSLSFSSASG